MYEKLCIDYLENVTHHRAFLQFPTAVDLSGAATALTRLQQMYKLNISHIANGILNGVKYRWVYFSNINKRKNNFKHSKFICI